MKTILKTGVLISSIFLFCCGSSNQNLSQNDLLKIQYSEKNLCAGALAEKWEAYGGGAGTKENPYLICTPEQFRAIRGDMNEKRYFKLTSDLDFENKDIQWGIPPTPIASIDGDGHTLRNIKIDYQNGIVATGIYGRLVKDLNGHPDEIKNLFIENIHLIGNGKSDAGGLLAAVNEGGVISNVHIGGGIELSSNAAVKPSSYVYAGGIVGRNESVIEKSSFVGDIQGTFNVGGIAGINEGIIRDSTTNGQFHGNAGVGGIVGVQLATGSTIASKSDAQIFGKSFSEQQIGLTCNSSDYGECSKQISD